MTDAEKATGAEERTWSEEDIKEFKREFAQGGDPDKPSPHGGVTMLGIVIFSLTVYSLYKQMWDFALYNTALLVVLALGSKSIN